MRIREWWRKLYVTELMVLKVAVVVVGFSIVAFRHAHEVQNPVQTRHAQLGVAGSDTLISRKSLHQQDTTVRPVRERLFICPRCNYHVTESNISQTQSGACPRCGSILYEV